MIRVETLLLKHSGTMFGEEHTFWKDSETGFQSFNLMATLALMVLLSTQVWTGSGGGRRFPVFASKESLSPFSFLMAMLFFHRILCLIDLIFF